MPSTPTGRPDRSGSDPLKKGRLSDEDARRLDDGASAEADSASLDGDTLADDELVAEDRTDLDESTDDDSDEDDREAAGTTLTKKRARAGTATTASDTTTATTKSRTKAKSARGGRERSGNPFVRLVRFLREVVGEMRKVLWPSRRELGIYTVAVIIFVTVLVAIVGGLDYGFARLVLLIFG